MQRIAQSGELAQYTFHLVDRVVESGELAQHTLHLVERIAQSGELAQFTLHLVERVAQGDELVQQASKGPHVAAELVGEALDALGGHVVGCADCTAGLYFASFFAAHSDADLLRHRSKEFEEDKTSS